MVGPASQPPLDPRTQPETEILAIETTSLGDRSYVVTDGVVAIVVDPQRDIDRVQTILEQRRLLLTHVLETHLHNDYLTGGYALAQATGATYGTSAGDPVAFDRQPLVDGDAIRSGRAMTMHVVASPGHTFTHLSYVLEVDGRVKAVFTGGSLLYGSTGRPDLLGAAHTDELARAQHRSANRLAAQLPEATPVYPTHGFGGFCASSEGQSPSAESTIATERRTNTVLRLSEDDFVANLVAGLDAYPAYYAHLAPRNLAGPGSPDLSPVVPVDRATLARRLANGEWVVDVRAGDQYAAAHLAGSLNIGLDGSFAAYLGWLLPWGTPVTLLADTADEIAEAQRELVRIGVDRPAGAAIGSASAWAGGEVAVRSYPVAGFKELADKQGRAGLVVLDVRLAREWREGHLQGAVHIPVHELPRRLAEVPPGEVWVHCESGYRTAIGASLLDSAARRVVAVLDDFEAAESAGLSVVYPDGR